MRDACLPNGNLQFSSCMTQKPSLAKKKIVHWTSYDLHKRANAAFLMGTYLQIYHEKSPEEAARLIQHGPAFVTFRLALHNAGMPSVAEAVLNICSYVANHFPDKVSNVIIVLAVLLQGCISTVPDIPAYSWPLLLSSFKGGQNYLCACAPLTWLHF